MGGGGFLDVVVGIGVPGVGHVFEGGHQNEVGYNRSVGFSTVGVDPFPDGWSKDGNPFPSGGCVRF